jgi:carboxyl-terminal processing protease
MSGVVAHILGRPGTTVHLVVDRSGRTLQVTVRRATIHAPAVNARLVSFAGRRWGVVHVSEFAVGTSVLVRREVALLERQGATGLVLDLRDDPGGLLAQAVTVASVFIDHGVIVSLQGAHQPQEQLRAIPGPTTHLPLVVLVDRYTASSAEIVAGALRDHHRATIVGEHTFGKALVQSVDPLQNGAALKLSVAHYTTPSGEDLAGVGIAPQIRVRDDPRTPADEALATALHGLA